MKKWALFPLIVMLVGLWMVIASDRGLADQSGLALAAFPGAEGFGAVALGGRGGKVIHVTIAGLAVPWMLSRSR